MITLDEYLGVLVSNLSQARVLADLESAKIAGMYAENNLLKHFSIPRMKFEEIELSIPVAIDQILSAPHNPNVPVNMETFAALTYATILRTLGTEALPANFSKDIKTEINKQIDVFITGANKDNYEDLLYEYIVVICQFVFKNINALIRNNVIKAVDNNGKREITNRLTNALQEELKGEINFTAVASKLRQLKVIVEADKLKEKSPNTLVIIKMKINEEGVIWEKMDDGNGNIISKLMPY